MALSLRSRIPSCRHAALAPSFLAFITLVLGMSVAAAPTSYLDNGVLRVGVDLARGGAIRYLSPSGSGQSVVNLRDLGRYIQQSYYSGPDPFIPPGAVQHPAWAGWGWNPVQAGDAYGHQSQVVVESNDGATVYVQSVPKQWALLDVDSECTLETWVTLDANRVHVRNRLVNARSDTSRYGARHQELPAIYTVGTLHRLFTYAGDEPFTAGPLTQIQNSGPPWVYWSSSEHWSALVNDDGWGLGVFLPGATLTVGGFHGSPGWGGPTSNNTGYLAPLHTDLLDHDIVYEYEYTLILGDLHDDIRAYAYQQRPPPGPHHVFDRDRAHCLPHNLSDASPPYDGSWRLTLDRGDPQVVLPPGRWVAADVPRILITCAHHTQTDQAEIFFAGPDGSFSGDRRLAVAVIPDGEVRTYAVDLSTHPLYTGVITRLRFDPIQFQSPGDVVDLHAITTVSHTATPPSPAPVDRSVRITGASPNPLNPRTTLSLDLSRASAISLAVYDLRGRRVRSLFSGRLQAGAHEVAWDGCDELGNTAPAGLYVARLVSGDGSTAVVKLTLLP